jgi:hypothetical protein
MLADSLLKANPDPSADDAAELDGLAALTGRVHAAARLQRKAGSDYVFLTSDWQEIKVPSALSDPALALLVYASFGAPMDSLVGLEQRIERLIPSYVEPRRRRATREALLDQPAELAFPERGLRPVHRPKAAGSYLLEMQWALAKGDTLELRRQFEELRLLRQHLHLRPGDIGFKGTYHEARLLLALGDTAAASHLLDLSLDALPTLGTHLLDLLPEAATLVRGMSLRSELAAQAGESAMARRWANNVVTLWSGADSELQPVVARMQQIAR